MKPTTGTSLFALIYRCAFVKNDTWIEGIQMLFGIYKGNNMRKLMYFYGSKNVIR